MLSADQVLKCVCRYFSRGLLCKIVLWLVPESKGSGRDNRESLINNPVLTDVEQRSYFFPTNRTFGIYSSVLITL